MSQVISVKAFSSKESKEFQKHYEAVLFCIKNELSYPIETSNFFKGKIGGDSLEDVKPSSVLKYIENGVEMKMPLEYENGKTFIRVKEIPFGCDLIGYFYNAILYGYLKPRFKGDVSRKVSVTLIHQSPFDKIH